MPKGKKIATPEILWNLFLRYKKQTKENFRIIHVVNQRTGLIVQQPCEVPLTKEGFYEFCSEVADIATLKDYFSNKDKRYSEYAPITTRIMNSIRKDQIEGGMVGQYNSNITARISDLSERIDVSIEQPLFGDTGEKE